MVLTPQSWMLRKSPLPIAGIMARGFLSELVRAFNSIPHTKQDGAVYLSPASNRRTRMDESSDNLEARMHPAVPLAHDEQ